MTKQIPKRTVFTEHRRNANKILTDCLTGFKKYQPKGKRSLGIFGKDGFRFVISITCLSRLNTADDDHVIYRTMNAVNLHVIQ
jgi:hypothetical protein